MSSRICSKCGNTHDCQTNCDSPRKSQSIPNDTRNARCTICSDWFHRDGILNHIRSCATKKIQQLESENDRLRKAIEDVRHKGYCATVKHVCKGIEIEKGVFSGCAGLSDCPECNGVKHTCSCGIDDWKDSVLNNNRNALEKP